MSVSPIWKKTNNYMYVDAQSFQVLFLRVARSVAIFMKNMVFTYIVCT